PREVVLGSRGRRSTVTTVLLVLLVAALAAALLLLAPTAVLTFACTGLLAWALAMVAGLVAGTVDLNRRGGAAAAKSQASQQRFMTISVLAGAAITPALALLIPLAGPAWTGASDLASGLPVAAAVAVG